MLYKFKCKAAGDLVMLGPQGDELLRLMGREPAARGIIEAADLGAALAALEAAVLRSEPSTGPADDAADDEAPADESQRVSLRQRAWPLRELLRRAHDAQAAVVWGV